MTSIRDPHNYRDAAGYLLIHSVRYNTLCESAHAPDALLPGLEEDKRCLPDAPPRRETRGGVGAEERERATARERESKRGIARPQSSGETHNSSFCHLLPRCTGWRELRRALTMDQTSSHVGREFLVIHRRAPSGTLTGLSTTADASALSSCLPAPVPGK